MYLFNRVSALPIHIGKSVNLRERLRLHFSGNYCSTNDQRLHIEITHITHITVDETAGKLDALLREAPLLKSPLPLKNHRFPEIAMVFTRVAAINKPPAKVLLQSLATDFKLG